MERGSKKVKVLCKTTKKNSKPNNSKNNVSSSDDDVPLITFAKNRTKVEQPIKQAGTTSKLPIFTCSFHEHNKEVEKGFKTLRKQSEEFDEQNSILMHHAKIMENRIASVENETEILKEQNLQLENYEEKARFSSPFS